MKAIYLIHQYPYGENAAILRVWSADEGFFSAMLKNNKNKVKYKTQVRPFISLLLELSGRGQLLNVKQIEPQGNGYRLKEKWLWAGLYLNELLMYFLPEKEPCPDLFNCYETALSALEAQKALEPVLRAFEFALFRQLGYLPTLSVDENDQSIDPVAYYELRPESLPKKCTLEGLRTDFVYLGAHLLAMEQESWEDPKVLRSAKHLMRTWVKHYTAGKLFKSRSFFIN